MLLTALSSFSWSQPNPDLSESAEDVEAEPNLEFQLALFKNYQSDFYFIS